MRALLASAARTADANTDDQVAPASVRGVLLVLDVTAAPAESEDTLTVEIQAKDPASGKYLTLTKFTASKKGSELESGTTLGFTLYPGGVETAATDNHEVQGLPLPQRWRAVVNHSGEDEWTYSLGALALR